MEPIKLYELTRERAKAVPVRALVEASGVSPRHVFRFRAGQGSCSVEILQAIYAALKVVKPAKKPTAKRPAAPSAASATTRRQARSAATSASGDDAGSAGLGA